MARNFDGKVAIVTGASSGIGLAAARLLAERGAAVVLAARRDDEIAGHAEAIRAAGGQASHIRTDVSVSEDVQAMVAHAVATFGRLDIAVNNAGVEGQIAMIVDMPDDNFERVCGINLRGNFLCLKYESRAMLNAGNGGAIVNIGSVNSFLGTPGAAAYVSSKHGQVGLTTSASAELAPQGIRVNIVCPGLVRTPMHQRIRDTIGDAAIDQGLISRVHQRRAGEPGEIARAIAFLCSDEASYITGATLTPDGGFMMTL